MKNIIKYLSALCAMLLFASCPNPLELDNVSSGAKSGIKITISGEGVGARTLFPSMPNFTKFELHFNDPGGQNTHDAIVLDAGKSEIIVEDLALGNWEITALGFITINGNFIQAADGEAEIEVKPWESGKTTFQSVNIPINVRQKNGENGTFYYNIDFPSSVNSARLYIYDVGGSVWDEGVYATSIYNRKTDSRSLAPGYYMMTMRFDNGYKVVVWTEVIHIYSHAVTEFVKVFDESLISGVITLSGKADISIDGANPDWSRLDLYYDAKYSNLYSFMEANNSSGEMFPISMLEFNEPVTFYLKLIAGKGDALYTREIGFITLYKDDYVFNIKENFESIKLGGTSKITVVGKDPLQAYIRIYRADNNELLTVNAAEVNPKNSSWEAVIEKFDSLTEVYFEVEAMGTNNSIYYKRADITVNAFNVDIPNIHIEVDVGLLTVSGTANITINGVSAKYAGITMRKVSYNDNGEEILGGYLDHYEIDYSEGNTFELSINYLKDPIQVYFDYRCKDLDDNYFEGTVELDHLTLHNANVTGINLNVNINMVSLSGTASIIVNGDPAKWAYVNMYRTSDDMLLCDSTEIDYRTQIENEDGETITNPNYLKWKMIVNPSFTQNTSVYFIVTGMTVNDEFFRKNVLTMNVHNISISDIELKINTVDITLSGTITLANGFRPPEGEVEIIALTDNIGYIGGTSVSSKAGSKDWSITVKSFSSSTTVRFMLRWGISGSEETYSYFPRETASVHESNVPNINLGSRILNPSYPFNDTGSEPKWTANVNPAWLFDDVGKVEVGEYYALDFTFVTQYLISDLDVVLRDLTLCDCEDGEHTCYDASVLSDVRRVESRRNLGEGASLTGTVVFTINKSASGDDPLANTLHFMVPGTTNSRPTLTFSNLVLRKIEKQISVNKWPIKVKVNDDIFKDDELNIPGPGITTTAEIISYEGENNVLHVKPGPGGYYHFVVEYDLSAYAGKRININISTDYWIPASTRIAWQVDNPNTNPAYPIICGGTNTLGVSTNWRPMTGSNTIDIPLTGDGRRLYLSAQQLGSYEAFFSNFEMTITEQ